MGKRGIGARTEKDRKAAALAIGREPMDMTWQDTKLPRLKRLIAFLQALPVTKGIQQGEKFDLLPVQRDFLKDVYGGREDSDVRIGVLSAPRGNGKTGLIAGLALAHLLGPESEIRGEVYSAAIDRQQAALIFAEMVAILDRVPEIGSRCNIVRWHKRIEVADDGGIGAGSLYEALSADARRAHGLAPSFWAYDELAQAKDRELLDNLQTAMGKRNRSLGMIISTQAPTDDHALSQMIDDGLNGSDRSIRVRLLTAPEDANPFDKAVIKKVNPAFGRFLKEADVMLEADRAKRLPAFLPAFRNLRLNQRVDSSIENRVLTRDVWELGDVPVDLENLAGKECFAGLDLSAKHDLTALILAFPDQVEDPIYEIVLKAWTPLEALRQRTPTEFNIFRQWIEAGFLIPVPGPIVRYSFVAQELAKLRQQYKIRAIAYDRWRIDDLKQELDAIGLQENDLPMMPFGQGYQSMAPAIEWFVELAKSGRIWHGNNPVLSAAISNTITVPDAAGNLKFDKSKSSKVGTVRIDPAVALVMALGAAKRAEAAPDVNAMIV